MATNSTKSILGSGGYGTVYRGEWNNKKVAVKRTDLAKCENNIEEEALQKLDHPNVVKLYHIESDLDFRHYALELCQASLDHKFLDDKDPAKYRGPMPLDEEVFHQLAKGLAHIHQNRFIHRDLKPHNVLIWVDSTGEKVLMKWADFGLSKQVNPGGSHSISGMRGTQNWYSPEILKIFIDIYGNDGKTTKTTPNIRQRGTVKSDVFSAGLVFGYYLLGGDHPFGSLINVLRNILENKPINLTKIKEHPMHAIIMEMLKDNPNERMSSADVVKFFTIQKNNLIEPQLRIWRSFQLNGNTIPILIELGGYSSLKFDVTVEDDASLYDTLLQLISKFDATCIAEIFRLLLEIRAAIPLLVPESKKHFLSLLRHVTLPRVNNISLGDDKSLQRVVVISCRKMDQSRTCDILKSVFHIESLHALDLSQRNITSETMLAEIGCGCIVTEGSVIQNVLVAHVIGDFRPLWSFLRRFADCFIIEDSTVEAESFFSSFMTEEKKREMDSEDAVLKVTTNRSISCIWKPSHGRPSIKQRVINGFTHLYIEDQLSGKSYNTIKARIVDCLKMTSTQPNFAENRLGLWNIPLLLVEGYSSLECVSPTKVQQLMGKSVQNLENVKKNEFLLQKSFLQEAKHEEVKMENRLKEEIVRGKEDKIEFIRERRQSNTRQVETDKLIQLFLSFLDCQDPCSRVLSIRVLEKELANRREQELGPLLETVQMLSTSYYDKLHKASDEKDLESAKKQLLLDKSNLIESALNIEHLWRELSHLYTDMENRSPVIQKIPQLAAQHLLDGFCLELLDGDSNLIRQEWVNEVLFQLDKLVKGKRVFVLSVMGVQSSGKSTLLNTMFGIRMRTGKARMHQGQCTRGVNMQLLAVEGRPQYDYILLLDTEGTRSPEYHGLAGSEKRDNQMATLSILLSDATIIVIPGENDAAVKEILPIVLMAYQGSQLAEDNGGRLSSRIFFVYNRIDTKQKIKLDTIIQTLGISLHEAFSQVQNMTGNSSNLKSESPFTNFNLTSTDSSRSDVCILGNVNKQYNPPGDVPDEEYREGLIQFQEHIHQRVTTVEGGIRWKSRSISEFSRYIKNVWECICSANFTFTFVTVMEHAIFDKLDSDYKKIERKLAAAYEKSFKNVKREMIKSIEERKTSISFKYFEDKLRDQVHLDVEELNTAVDDVVNKKGQEKWELQFQNMWNRNKKDQELNWRLNLKNAYDRLFHYENRVEEYKKEMRKEINAFFKSPKNSKVTELKQSEKDKKFEDMFKKILDEAKKEFPSTDVKGEVKKVFQNSTVIEKKKIEINWTDPLFIEPNLLVGKNKEDKMLDVLKRQFFRLFYDNGSEKEKRKQNSFIKCADSVNDAVNRITAGTLCYDNSIVSHIIREIDSKLCEYHLTDHSVVQGMFQYGMELTVHLMKKVQDQWEKENSVPAKLESNKENLRMNFMAVSNGVAKTKLFATYMADLLEEQIIPAFENEMVQRTLQGLRYERWLYDARFMQKYMDLHLIYLLEREKLDQVLDYLRNPQTFYADVLHLLIAQKVPNVDERWQTFRKHLRDAIKKAAAVEVDKEKAQTFVDHLRKEFLDGYLQSETLHSAFLIDCSGEYEDCDNEEKKQFQEACLSKLIEVLEKQEAIKDKNKYSKQLSPKVVQHMKKVNDKAALPRCDLCCRLCNSLCIEAANHDTQDKPHDAVHQPGGVAGQSYMHTDELVHRTCHQSYEKDGSFHLNNDLTVSYRYRDYAKVFPGWKDPRSNEELPLREYILATYNKEIAKKYNKKPSTQIPSSYSSRTLSSMKEQLEREIAA